MKLFVCVLLLGLGGSGIAQAPQQPSMQDSLAAAVRSLGICQTELGGLRMLQADVIAGKLVDWNQIKKQLEAANPTLIFDVQTRKVSQKLDQKETTPEHVR